MSEPAPLQSLDHSRQMYEVIIQAAIGSKAYPESIKHAKDVLAKCYGEHYRKKLLRNKKARG